MIVLSEYFNSILSGEGVTFINAIVILGCSALLGFLISFVYLKTHKVEVFERTLPVTLFIMPSIVASIILLIGDNLASAFSLAGIFALIRFRANTKDSKDLAYILLDVVIGAALGVGYVMYGVLTSILILLILIVLKIIKYGEAKETEMQLKIIVPENLNYSNLFDDILNNYTDFYHLDRVKTSDFGTMFELTYRIRIKKSVDQKSFIDELRCRNGNLNITLTMLQG